MSSPDRPDRGGHAQERPAVLVTDGEERAALAVVRSLGQAGYRVHVSARRPGALAATSRWTAGCLVTPDPLRASREFVDAVAQYVLLHGIRLVIPITDASMPVLLAARDRLSDAIIPFGSIESFQALADKAGLEDRARQLGIAFPGQKTLTWDQRKQSLDGEIEFPIVIKPARSVGESGGQRAKFGVLHASNSRALRAAVETLPAAAYPLLLQRRIVGPGVGVFLLLWNGQVVARFAHRRIREKPPSGGVSVYAESIATVPDLAERSEALLAGIGWRGVAMVEDKVDAASGTPYLMEINGRFWGSVQLAIDAGVDFPRLLAECALAGQPASIPPYRTGVHVRWWWGEVDHLLARLRHSDAALSLPPGAPTRIAALRAFLGACLGGDGDAVWRRDDPRPFLSETLAWFRRQ